MAAARALSLHSFNLYITCQEAAAHCYSHPVQHQEDPEAEVAGQSCPQEVEAAAEAKEVYDASGAQPTKATVKQMTGT